MKNVYYFSFGKDSHEKLDSEARLMADFMQLNGEYGLCRGNLNGDPVRAAAFCSRNDLCGVIVDIG